MNTVTIYAFASVIIISLISLIGVFTLGLNQSFLKKITFFLVSLAVGALFGDAIIHLIPEAFEKISNPAIASLFILAGIISFLILEKFLRWRHAHGHNCDTEKCDSEQNNGIKPVGSIIIASDSAHNFIDGIIIGTSYLISIEIGIATTVAIILHEIPQEISDFALLLHAGFSKMKAILLNFFSALFSVAGAALVFTFGLSVQDFIPSMVAFAAGGFLYIAGSDLVPEIHKISDVKKSFQQFIAIILGITIMFALLMFEI